MASPTGTVTKHQRETVHAQGFVPQGTAITATTDGLTTGLIPHGATWVDVTAGADANSIITLPVIAAADVGMEICGYIGATGCEMRTPAASGDTINGVDSDGTNEAAIPATTLFRVRLVADNTWILEAVDEGGDDIAGITPD